MAQDQNNLIWLDMEMTGLAPDKDRIIEVAIVVTDSQLDILGAALEARRREWPRQAGQERGARRHLRVDREAQVLPGALPEALVRKRDDLSGIHQVFRVDGVLQAGHEVDRLTQFLPQVFHLAE